MRYYERIIGLSEEFIRKYDKSIYEWKFNVLLYLYLCVFCCSCCGLFAIMRMHLVWNPSKDSSIESYELILVFVMIFAAIAIIFAKSRITVVLLNGVLGYSVAFFFVIFRAPDLALTQLVVESVTTALFLISV